MHLEEKVYPEIGLNLKLWDTQAEEAALNKPAVHFPALICSTNATDKLETSDYFFSMFTNKRVQVLKPVQAESQKQVLLDELKNSLPLNWDKKAIETVLKNYAKHQVSFKALQKLFGNVKIDHLQTCYAALQQAQSKCGLPQELGDFFTLQDLDKLNFKAYKKEKMPAQEESSEEAADLFSFDEDAIFEFSSKPKSAAELQFEEDLTHQKQTALDFLTHLWHSEELYLEKCSKMTMRNFLVKCNAPYVTGIISRFIIKDLCLKNDVDLTSDITLEKILEKLDSTSPNYRSIENAIEHFKYILNPAVKCLVDKSLCLLETDTPETAKCIQQFEECTRLKSLENVDVDGVFSTVQEWLDEQGLHAFLRFQNLILFYTSFINSMHTLSKVTERVFNKLGQKERPQLIQHIVKDIFQYSHIVLEKSEKNGSEKAQLISVHHQGHRSEKVMGGEAEQDQLTPAQKIKIAEKFNLYLGMYQHMHAARFDITVKQLDRAHTLPFPVNFAWKWDRVRAFMGKHLESTEDIAASHQTRPHFSKKIFKEAQSINDPSKIECLLSEAFEFYAAQADDAAAFILQTLRLSADLYLRLFSEAELMFEFINKDIDTLSEWNHSDATYKKTLADALINLLQLETQVDQKTVLESLRVYLETTQKVISAYLDTLAAAKTDNPTPALLFLEICATQVQEGLMQAKKMADK